jgi:hypothetical protein
MYNISRNKQYLILGFIYIISFMFILFVNKKLSTEHSHSDGIYKLVYDCIFFNETNFCKKLTSTRGKKYYTITADRKASNEEDEQKFKKNQEYCLVSLWAVCHVYLYIVIGFFCPNLFVESFIIGALFEYFEKMKWDCHDGLDVIFNSFGFGIGYFLNKLIFKNNGNIMKKSIISFILLTIVLLLVMIQRIQLYQKKINNVN